MWQLNNCRVALKVFSTLEKCKSWKFNLFLLQVWFKWILLERMRTTTERRLHSSNRMWLPLVRMFETRCRGNSYEILTWLTKLLLPLANEVFEGYVFTPVRQSFCSGAGVCIQGGGVCIRGVWQTRPPPIGYYRIRSTSGRYASYWNAFLFSNYIQW